MKRTLAIVSTIAMISTGLQATATPPAAAAEPAPEVVAIHDQLQAVAGWADDLASLGALGEQLPLLDLAPGGPEALDLAEFFGTTVSDAVDTAFAALGEGEDLAAFAAELSDAPPLAATDVPVDEVTNVGGLDVAITHTVETTAPLLVEADGISLRSVPEDGSEDGNDELPITLTFELDIELRHDGDTGETWLVHRPASDPEPTPGIAATADVDMTFGDLTSPFTSALGIARVQITDGSHFALDADLALPVDDPDGDGRLAFMEPAEGGTMTPGELTLPVDQIVEVDLTGTLDTTFELETDRIGTSNVDGTPSLTATAADIGAGAPTITPSSGFDDLTPFGSIDATELLGGVGQLSLALTGLVRNPDVDAELPFLDASVADVLPVADDLSELVLELTLEDDPDTLQNEFGQADFATLDELVEEMEAQLPGVASLAPQFDADTQQVTLPLSISEEVGDPGPITVPDVDGEPVEIGSLELGEGLSAQFSWLSGMSSSAGPVATAEFGYEVDIDWGIDLQPATPCDDCDDEFTEEFIENEEPPVYRRFLIGGGEGDEVSLTALVEADASSLGGSVGYVGVEAQSGSRVSLGSDTTPIATLDLQLDDTSTDAPEDLVPVYALLRSFSTDPLDGFAVSVEPTLTVPAALDLTLGIPMEGELADIGSSETVELHLTWDDILDDPAPTTDTSVGDVDLLSGFDLGDPNALLGVLLDHIGALASELAGFADGTPVLDDPIPFTSVRPAELVEGFGDLADAIADIRSGVEPESLQEFVDVLGDAIDADGLTFSVADIGGDETPDLVIDLQVNDAATHQLPVALDLPSGDLAGIGDGGAIEVGATADLGLTFPVPVALDELPSDPADLPLDESSALTLDVSGHLTGPVTLTLAGVDVGLDDPGEARLGFEAGFDASDGDSDDLTTVGDLLSKLAGGGVSVTPAGNLDCLAYEGEDTVTVNADLLCAAFPISVAGETVDASPSDPGPEDLLTVELDSFDLSTATIEHPDLGDILDDFVLDLASLPDLIDRLATLLTAGMELGGNLPVVGDSLDRGADVVTKVQTDVKQSVEAATEVTGTVEDVRTMLEDTVATSLVDSGLLLKSDYDGDASDDPAVDDVLITISDSAGDPLLPEDDAVDIADITVEFGLGEGDPDDLSACSDCTTQLPLDLGLPAINVRTDGQLEAGYAWFVHLGIGVSRTDGPYILENPQPPVGGTDDDDEEDELRLHTQAGMADDLSAAIGVFEFAVTDELPDPEADDPERSGIELDVTSNLTEPEGSTDQDRITLAELPGLVSQAEDALDPTIDVVADFELGLTATAGSGLPQVRTVLDLDWEGLGSDDPAPTVEFDDFELNLGSLFSDTFEPILNEVRRLTEPVDPIREFLFSPLPVLSEVSRMFGGDDVTFVDLAEIFGGADLSLLDDINTVVDVANAIADAGLGDEWFAIGDGFFVDPDKALEEEPTAAQAMSLVTFENPGDGPDKPEPDPEDLKDEASGKAAGTGALFDTSEGDFSLPLFDEPTCLFGMALGGDCTILEWTPDPLELEFQYEQPFGPFFGVLYVTIGGYAGAGAKFGIGYDTHGARRLIRSGEPLSASATASAVLDGVFLIDFDGPELFVAAGITAGAKLDAGIAEAGARGGIGAELGMDLRDGPEFDGKLRIEEILTRIHNPLCLFDVAGALKAFLEVYVEIGACPFCVEKSFELARVVLLDFSAALAECDQDPLLARTGSGTHPAYADGSDDLPYVELVVGDLADPHRRILTGKSDENFTVRELRAPVYEGPGDSDNRPGLYSVTAFGHTQTHDPDDENATYEGYWVEFDAGGGDDTLLFQGSKAGGSYASQEEGDGVPAFTAPVVGTFSSGTNLVTTGEGADDITGGSEADQITLLGGDDQASGNGGDDILAGGFGNDDLSGNGGHDRFDGGPGGDHLSGGSGEDRIDGGRTATLNDGTVVDGGRDLADTIEGGSGDDLIFAGEGDDTVYGNTAADAAFPETGETITGVFSTFPVPDEVDPDPTEDDFNDEIHGEDGDDTIYGGHGRDLIYGDVEDEDTTDDPTAEQCGRGADDTIYGQSGQDVAEGSRGCDEIHGGTADDELFGGPADDLMFGDSGDDEMFGTTGDDDMYGGTGDDELHGEDGDDDIVGNLGEDHAEGGPGEDHIAGDDADIADGGGFDPTIDPDEENGDPDTLFGGDDDDHLYGQGDDDHVRGGRHDDVLFGNGGDDDVFGDRHEDLLYGNAGDDTLEGGPEDDLAFGNDGSDHLFGQAGGDRLVGGSDPDDDADHVGSFDDTDDFLFGGAGMDVLLGDNGAVGDVADEATILPINGQTDEDAYGDDELDGGPHDDVLHGQDGNDTLWGAGGDDQLFGELHDDHLFGQAGHDVMLGDRGRVTPAPADPDQPNTLPGGSRGWTVTLVEPDDGGVDDLHGGLGDDHGFAGADNDLLEGGVGDDHLEGNGGRDEMYGLSVTFDDGVEQDSDLNEGTLLATSGDQDDLIGGSSSVHPDLHSAAGAADEGETVMLGNADDDVMAGDNAEIDKVVSDGDSTSWGVDDVTGGHLRDITLWDREKAGTGLEFVSGGDRMLGNDHDDRMYGQGSADVLKGNDHDDFVQGNQDDDLIEGNDGEDDLIGGSEFTNSPTGDPDGADAIHGGDDADVLLGDNGVITRDPEEDVEYTYVTTQLGIESQRAITLLDLDDPPDPDNFGDDLLSGGDDVDVEFGQDGDDVLSGGPADDYQEGNGGSDGLFGDRLPDDATLLDDADAAGLTVPALDADVGECDEPFVPDAGTCLSPDEELHGEAGPDGQDDQIGGSSREEHRDDDDVLYGDGAADFQLGDNGELLRTIEGGDYQRYDDYNPTTIVRQANRFDVGGPADDVTHGDDVIHGNDGDDYQWGQDGGDEMHGGADNDDMYGELGDDVMFGGPDEDAMIGDRGLITDRKVVAGDEVATASANVPGPTFLEVEGLRPGDLDRRVDLLADGDGDMDDDGDDVEFPGLHHGGDDRMRGGPDHDVMHGAFGNDLMNGDDGGDWLFGADGADVIWGGKGASDPDPEAQADPGTDDGYIYGSNIDVIFGGHSGQDVDWVPEGADVLDFRPVNDDPDSWFEMTDTDDEPVENNQHHHGVDWIYGGWGRDVLQGDIGKNGPEEFGDRLVDWVGNYNLYLRCNASYGDDGDVRQRAPQLEDFLETLAFITGVGETRTEVEASGTSAYRELALVYQPDTKDNNGSPFPGTPGNFDDPNSCTP